VDWLLTREAVIGLAIVGALFSVAASALQVRGAIGAPRARQLNVVGYACMGVSMLLFIIVGMRGGPG
jgi:hypothetical protein